MRSRTGIWTIISMHALYHEPIFEPKPQHRDTKWSQFLRFIFGAVWFNRSVELIKKRTNKISRSIPNPARYMKIKKKYRCLFILRVMIKYVFLRACLFVHLIERLESISIWYYFLKMLIKLRRSSGSWFFRSPGSSTPISHLAKEHMRVFHL